MKKINGETGQTIIFVALSMTMLIGFAALATDMGVVFHEKREAQTAADAAALAAATEALAEGNPTTLSSGEYNAALTDASANGFTGSSTNGAANNGTTLTVNIGSNITVPTFKTAGYVQAIITQTTPTLFTSAFMSLFGNTNYSGMTVATTAIASDTITSNGCVYVNNPALAADPAVYMSGNSLIFSPKCGVSINGNLQFNGNKASIDAEFVAASGTISNGASITGASASGVPPQPNPLPQFNLTPNQPTAGKTAGGACGSVPSGTTLSCIYDFDNGNLTGPLTLASGIYYFDVPVTISGAVSSASGGVVFYIANNVSFDFDANGTMTLSPPLSNQSDLFYNILLDAPNLGPYTTCQSGKGNNGGNAGELYFDFGSSNTTLNGIVYAPNAQLFEQDSGATMSINTDLVIGNICQQSATFSVNGLTANSPIKKAGLVY